MEIPEDIDKDNYKIVIGKSHDGDDVLDLYINKVKSKVEKHKTLINENKPT